LAFSIGRCNSQCIPAQSGSGRCSRATSGGRGYSSATHGHCRAHPATDILERQGAPFRRDGPLAKHHAFGYRFLLEPLTLPYQHASLI
jgi:hypothetical protein